MDRFPVCLLFFFHYSSLPLLPLLQYKTCFFSKPFVGGTRNKTKMFIERPFCWRHHRALEDQRGCGTRHTSSIGTRLSWRVPLRNAGRLFLLRRFKNWLWTPTELDFGRFAVILNGFVTRIELGFSIDFRQEFCSNCWQIFEPPDLWKPEKILYITTDTNNHRSNCYLYYTNGRLWKDIAPHDGWRNIFSRSLWRTICFRNF